MTRKCIQCGKDFQLSDGEIKFYKEKGLELPKRCEECRDKNKKKDADKQNTNSSKPAQSKTKSNKTTPIVAGVLAVAAIISSFVFGTNSDKNNTPDSSSVSVSGSMSSQAEVTDDNTVDKSATEESSETITDESSETTEAPTAEDTAVEETTDVYVEYEFRNYSYLESHFEKHGDEFDYDTIDEYLDGANRVINDDDALTKYEEEDNDLVYFLESTGELVIVSPDGYIRTYFIPDRGIDYFNEQ